MKHLLLTVRRTDVDGSTARTYLLEGDRRQTPRDMIHRAAVQLLGEPVEYVEEPLRARTPDGRELTVEDYDRINTDRVPELKRKHLTLVVNENVTEKACRVGYSGPFSGR